jgi:type IV pilus assembly protein PilW
MNKARGFTLVELMIAMVLGLVIIGSVMAAMLANKRSYRTNEGLAQVQESARTAFELLAHDIRQSDGNGCGRSLRTANVLTAGTQWWQNWYGMTGYDSTQVDPAVAIGTGVGERVAGTDSIHVESMDEAGLAVALHDPVTYRLDVSPATHNFVVGDVLMVCDFDHATIFQVSAVTGTTSVFHDTGIGTPGNCSRGLGFPTASPCTNPGNPHTFPMNSQIGRLVAVDWYIGNNGRAAEGGRSLYRRRLGPGGALVTEEIVAGVTNMQMRFRANEDDSIIASAALVADWSAISSVLIELTAESSEINATTAAPGVNTGRVQRTFNYLVSLRNRLP